MADNQNDDATGNGTGDNTENLEQNLDTNKQTDTDLVTKLVTEQVAEALKPIKEKLDIAYKARDAAEARVKDFEKKQREAELKKLQDDGKHKEAAELQVSEERARREAAERKVVELTRDLDLQSVLKTLTFRNDSAQEMAYRDIVTQLVQNEAGDWVHRSGVSIKDFAKAFSENADNAFLFKPKVSSGGGSSTTNKQVPSGSKGDSVFAMEQGDVLKLAAEGKLRRRR